MTTLVKFGKVWEQLGLSLLQRVRLQGWALPAVSFVEVVSAGP